MTEPKFEVIDDYTVKYDGDYFDLHKPSDIRSLVTVANYIVTENEQLKWLKNVVFVEMKFKLVMYIKKSISVEIVQNQYWKISTKKKKPKFNIMFPPIKPFH